MTFIKNLIEFIKNFYKEIFLIILFSLLVIVYIYNDLLIFVEELTPTEIYLLSLVTLVITVSLIFLQKLLGYSLVENKIVFYFFLFFEFTYVVLSFMRWEIFSSKGLLLVLVLQVVLIAFFDYYNVFERMGRLFENSERLKDIIFVVSSFFLLLQSLLEIAKGENKILAILRILALNFFLIFIGVNPFFILLFTVVNPKIANSFRKKYNNDLKYKFSMDIRINRLKSVTMLLPAEKSNLIKRYIWPELGEVLGKSFSATGKAVVATVTSGGLLYADYKGKQLLNKSAIHYNNEILTGSKTGTPIPYQEGTGTGLGYLADSAGRSIYNNRKDLMRSATPKPPQDFDDTTFFQ